MARQRPRDVFDKASEAIAAHEVLAGFVYRKSQHQLTRTLGSWSEWMAFTTTTRNTAEYVTLEIWVGVDDTQLAEWRERNAPARSMLGGRLFRRNVDDLTGRNDLLLLNFAGVDFESSYAKIVSLLAESILPLLADLRGADDEARLHAAVACRDPLPFVELFLCQGREGLIPEFLAMLDHRYPDVMPGEYTRMKQLLRGRPAELSPTTHAIADALFVTGLRHLMDPATVSQAHDLAEERRRSKVVHLLSNDLAGELRRWGENDVADAIGSLDDEAMARAERLAVRYSGERGTTVGQATALAVVEVIEGKLRPLHRRMPVACS